MKYIFLHIISILFLFGCKQTTELTIIPVAFDQTKLEICTSQPCAKITLNYVKAEGSTEIARNINRSIDSFIISSLNLGEEGGQMATSKDEAMINFIKAYRIAKTEFDLSIEYEAAIDIDEIYENDRVISMDFKNYLYTGGAHGNGSVIFKNFDKKTGVEIPSSLLFKNLDSFTNLAERKFRSAYQIPENESINSTGFWFDGEIFHLPENLGLNADGIILLYNAYDIASYADGPIELTITWDEVSEFLSKVYFP